MIASRSQLCRFALLVLSASALLVWPLPAALIPYSVDSTTLHLWHLDEAVTPCVDSVSSGTNLTVLANGASLGNVSYSGFGSALSTRDGGQSGTSAASKDAVLSPKALVNGTGDNVAMSFANPTNGAFTFEAIVRIDFDPTLNMASNGRNSGMQIISGEGDVTAERLFQWRLDPVGYGTGDTSVPRLEFINLHQEVAIQNIVVAIPTTGTNAIASNQWYHVAVVYNGNENTAGNLSFFWTLLDTNRSRANLIGTDNLVNDLSTGVGCDFAVGNEGRATGGNSDNFVGLIDEVRISSVARGPYDFYFTNDSDGDGLPDDWEMTYFNSLGQGATNDFDADGFSNLQEYLAGSNPTNVLSTPLDTDADGLPDAWELNYFGSLGQGPSGDPDGDSYTNLQEFNAGTNPNSAASNPGDTDADGLPDAWELANFGSLAQNGAGDYDGDGFSNLQEYQAGTNPNNANSFPPGPVTKYVPVEDGDPNTSEFGYAGTSPNYSAINTVAFIRSALITVSNRQFLAYYGQDATNPASTNNGKLVIARRIVGSNVWDVYRTTFTAIDINDGHDVVSSGIDGNGYLHISWGMHGNSFLYAKTTTPVTGNQPVVFGAATTMTGGENNVTYPQFITLPNGDLLFIFREGASGAGDTFINRYNRTTQSWTNQQYSAGQKPFIKGTGWTPDYNCYPSMPCLDANGTLYFLWVWRDTSAYESNHDFNYAKSTDGGLTWLRSNNSLYTLPISATGENGDPNTAAERILTIPQNYSLINQAGMCLDSSNNPVLATWWAPGSGSGNYRRQYMVAFSDTNGVWQTRQISNRTNDTPGTMMLDGVVRDLGRPVIVCDQQNRLIVLYRDNFGSNGLTIAHSLPYAVDPQRTNWTTFDLTTDNLGNYEPVIDLARWQMDNVLQILYQPSSSALGYTAPANNASPIGVLEWNAAAYFAHRPSLQLSFISGTNAALTFNSQTGWGYRVQTSTNLVTAWTTLATLAGNGGQLQYTHTNSLGISQRYWRLQSQEGGFGP